MKVSLKTLSASFALMISLNAAAVVCQPAPSEGLLGFLKSHFRGTSQKQTEPFLTSPLPIIREGRYFNKNRTLYKAFDQWLEKKLKKGFTHETLSPEQRTLFEKAFVEAQDSTWNAARPKMLAYHQELIAKRAKEAIHDQNTVVFKGRDYSEEAFLGSALEGSVFLVRDGSRQVVIKRFKSVDRSISDRKLAKSQKKALDKLSAAGISVEKVLDFDSDTAALKLTYADGITLHDIQSMVQTGRLSKDVLDAFTFEHARFYNEVMVKVGASINRGLDSPWFLNPHQNNVVYVPETGTFTIFDPR